MSTKKTVSDDDSASQEDLKKLREELLKDDIAGRLKHIIASQIPAKKRFPTLQKLTDISENTWRTWWSRGGSPNGTLIEATAKAWPEFAFWLVTGITDIEYGHRMPAPPVAGAGYVDNYPEGMSTTQPNSLHFEDELPLELRNRQEYSAEYFKLCKQLREQRSSEIKRGLLESFKGVVAKKRRTAIAIASSKYDDDQTS